MSLMFKEGVRFPPVASPIYMAIAVANEVYEEAGHDCVVTSIWDGAHSTASLHWVGHACDLRTVAAGIRDDEAQVIAQILTHRLPDNEFDVVVESDHIHVEYQPKR